MNNEPNGSVLEAAEDAGYRMKDVDISNERPQNFSQRQDAYPVKAAKGLLNLVSGGTAAAGINALSDALKTADNSTSYKETESGQKPVFEDQNLRKENLDLTKSLKKGTEQIREAAGTAAEGEKQLYGQGSQEAHSNYSLQLKTIEDTLFDAKKAEQLYSNTMTQLQDRMAENKKKATIDPIRFLREPSKNGEVGKLSIGRTTMAIIALGLGGYVAGFSGRENTALRILEKAVDDDVRAQQATFENEANNLIYESGLAKEHFNSSMFKSAFDLQAVASVNGGLSALLQSLALRDKSITSNVLYQQLAQQADMNTAEAMSQVQALGMGQISSGDTVSATTLALSLNRLADINMVPKKPLLNRYTLFPENMDKAEEQK